MPTSPFETSAFGGAVQAGRVHGGAVQAGRVDGGADQAGRGRVGAVQAGRVHPRGMPERRLLGDRALEALGAT